MRARLWMPLVAVVGAGLLVRLVALVSFPTTVYSWGDSLRFARVAPFAPHTGMFDDPWMPAGYPLLLRGIQQVTDALWVTVAAQHMLGLATAVLLYLTTRRLGAPRALALLPAAVVALSGDFVYMEHTILNEWLTVLMLAAGLYLTVRGATEVHRRLPWFLAAGAVLGLAAVVRNTALAAALVVIASVLLIPMQPSGLGERLRFAGALALTCAVVLGGYVGLATARGEYSGMADLRGWFLYGRTAPFAQCSEFTPRAELRVLCERSAPETRGGPFFYVNFAPGPGRQYFDLVPFACALREKKATCPGTEQDKVGAFARQAILQQPLAYAKAVTKDLFRYIDPDVGAERPYWGSEPDQNSFRYRDPATDRQNVPYFRQRYSGVRVESRAGRKLLESYQALFRLNGTLLFLAAVTMLAGLVLGRGILRRGALLFGLIAAALYIAPVASFSYDYRYSMIPQAFLVMAAALSAAAMLERRGRSAAPATATVARRTATEPTAVAARK